MRGPCPYRRGGRCRAEYGGLRLVLRRMRVRIGAHEPGSVDVCPGQATLSGGYDPARELLHQFQMNRPSLAFVPSPTEHSPPSPRSARASPR